MTRHRPAFRRAFTLIEAVAAVVILAIAIPPMLWSVRAAHEHRVDPMQGSRARWLAVAKLEEVIADRHSATRGYAWLTPGNYPIESPVPGSPGFSRRVRLRERAADLVTPGTGYMVVAVQVTWTDVKANLRTLEIQTVLTDYTP